MALTAMTCQRDGWQTQTDHLVLAHKAVGVAAIALARKTRRQPELQKAASDHESSVVNLEYESQSSENCSVGLQDGLYSSNISAVNFDDTTQEKSNGPSDEHDRAIARLSELEGQIARKTAAARIRDAKITSLVVENAVAKKRIAELEDQIAVSSTELVDRDNEIRSLEALTLSDGERIRSLLVSFELTITENERLSQSLAEKDGIAKEAFLQLEQQEAAITALKAERSTLVSEFNAVHENHNHEIETLSGRHQTEMNELNRRYQNEATILNNRLGIESCRALMAGKVIADLRHSMLQKIELLLTVLQAKERKIYELENLRTRLIDSGKALVETLRTRDLALAQIETKKKALDEQLAIFEATATRAKSQKKIEESNLQFERQCVERDANETQNSALVVRAELHHDWYDCAKDDVNLSDRTQAYCLKTVLANTIAF
jgi:hypothetical protein